MLNAHNQFILFFNTAKGFPGGQDYEKTSHRNRIITMIASQLNVHAGHPKAEGGVELFQNSPNPFIEMTLFWFRLPAVASIALRIFDAKGKEVNAKLGTYEAGENHVVLHRSDLREPGLYTCRLETPFGAVSRKLMMY